MRHPFESIRDGDIVPREWWKVVRGEDLRDSSSGTTLQIPSCSASNDTAAPEGDAQGRAQFVAARFGIVV